MNYFDAKLCREEAGKCHSTMTEINAKATSENRPYTTEEIQLFDEAKKQKQEWLEKAESAERAFSLNDTPCDSPATAKRYSVVTSNSKPTKKEAALALSAWAKFNSGMDLTHAEREAADRCELALHRRSISLTETNPVTNPENAVPDLAIQGIITARDGYNQLRQAVDVITTSTGGKLPWLYINDLSKKGVATDKNLGGYTNEGFTVEEKSMEDWLITSGVFPIPKTWLDDAYAMQSQIFQLLGERLGRTEEELCVSTGRGSDSKEPYALIDQITTSLYFPDPDSDTVQWYDVLQALQGQVSVYADAPGAGYAMTATMWNYICRSVDGIGRPIFVDRVTTQATRTVLSKPVYLLPSLGDKIIYGDLKSIKLRQVGSPELFIDPYTKRISNNAIQFGANERVDILVSNPLAVTMADVATSAHAANCGFYATAE